jgi:hypothetical protein
MMATRGNFSSLVSGVQHAAPIANRGNRFLGNGLGVMNNDAMGLLRP